VGRGKLGESQEKAVWNWLEVVDVKKFLIIVLYK
jgi:hypothetical protein